MMTTIDLAVLTAAQGTTIFGAEFGDQSGFSVSSAGDVNGDGFDDLLIGARFADASGNAKDRAGESYVIFGGPSLPATIDLANLGAAGITIFGADRSDQSGVSVSSAGDVNGDGFDDLLIGADSARAAGNAKPYAGESYVIFGGASLPSTIDLANLGAAGITIFGADEFDQSGSSVSSAGDVNGDGFDDLLIGARGADASGNAKVLAGDSYVIFGGPSLPSTIDLATLGTAGITIFGADEFDQSGRSVSSAGDVNGDGFDDLLIGAFAADASGNAKSVAGDSYVIFGGASLPSTIDLATLGEAGVTIFGADENDRSGFSVSSAGDVNGDGFDDLLIGAYTASASGNAKSNAGETYVIFGGASLPATIDLANLGAAGITIFGAEFDDQSGVSVSSAGDVNGDGFDDLLIGARDADASGNAKSSAGDSYVIFGGASLPSTIDLANLGTAGITIFGADLYDGSGGSVSSAGDTNGDGFDDLLIGARFAAAFGNAKSSAGDSYVIFGGNFTSAVTHQGTAAAETLTGTAGADVMIGDRGDDTLVGNGGADVLIGGQGNDILAVSDLSFQRIVGGTGIDTLRLDGSGLHLNLTTLADNRILGVEQIDLTGSGPNTLTLDLQEVLNISDESNTLVVHGNSGDQVLLDGGWTRGADEVIGSTAYRVLTKGEARLKVSNAISLLTPSTIDLAALTAAQGTTIFGAEFGDNSGFSVSSAGDVNGDGFDDLLTGANLASALGNARLSAGETYVIFGGPSLPATIDVANLGTAGITIIGADAGDSSGSSVSSAGDVNGDGFDDLLIGASDANASGSGRGRMARGESYVIFGGASLPATIDLASLGNAGITIAGADVDDRSGSSVSSAGDVNGDGFDDLLIGADRAAASGNAKDRAGESYLIFGGPSLPATIDLANLGAAGITIFGADTGDRSGSSVSSAGDVNGDGFDDLLIGAREADASGNAKLYAGESYVIFGGPSLPMTIDLANLGTAGITIFGADEFDGSAFVSSAGDVNGDGFDDLLIGAGFAAASGNALFIAGESYVIFGGASLPATIDLANFGAAGITIFGADSRDRSGTSVSSAGDVNGDGFDDLLIGAHQASASGNAKLAAGESYVIFGGVSLPATIDLANLGTAGITIFGADAVDNSGYSVSGAGDVNGDGFDDLLIGAFGALGSASDAFNTGESYVIFGGNFNSAVTHQGTSAAETLNGTASADVMVGDRGNDSLVGNGGADVLIGGQGNDILAVSDLSLQRIVGGTGTDTLRLDGSGLHLNLTTLADNRILGVEQIDLTGNGHNTLTLSPREVLNISDESNTLVVRRNLDDAVNIGTGWTQAANETIGTDTFQVYTQGSATLKVQAVVAVDTTAPSATIRSLPLTTTTATITLTIDTNDPAGASGEPVSGVASYDVYVAVDSGPFTLFAGNVPASQSTVNFTAASNHRYWFQAVAKDNAGNVEPTGGAETSTRTADVEGPNTTVLSATADASGLFTLNLQGSDVGGSRVSRFRVFVKIDNGTAVEIPQTNVSAGAANGAGVHSATTNYQGLRDGVAHTYTFFTRGVDSVGNLEAAPTDANADVRQTHTFAAPVALAANDIDVQNGQTQRSYIRNVDVLFNDTSGLQALIDNNRIRVERFDLLTATPTAGTGTLVNIAGATVIGNSIKLDFGANGLGGVGRAGNGFYRILVDTDGNGTFNDAHFEFFRLFGDSNGDGKVTAADGTVTEDLTGDGLVNANDRTIWRRETSFALLDSLFTLLDD